MVSKLKGFLSSDKIDFKNKIRDMLKGINLSIKIEGNTGEVWVDKFEFKKRMEEDRFNKIRLDFNKSV